LGWTYSFQGRLDDAIAECQKAIYVDPDFGNPYNDIGAYLIQQGKLDEAIPWLEKALQSRRYESYHYPHYNLGRVYAAKEMFKKATHHFEEALRLQPDYALAAEAIKQLKRQVN
jgi:Tfp pilus assembly protein PilF